ncbi:MAG: mercury resistance system transport protein MerF [Alphaproteobacteria bacterium]|jgi:mercuric ion transport protein|nr:mercury resistance system transport protein MerF [Alphaproteobacteria bacterium]
MKEKPLLGIGIVGTVVTAICCVTPVLVLLFGAIGLSALVVWLDFVLFPLLALFIALTAYAALRLRRVVAEKQE